MDRLAGFDITSELHDDAYVFSFLFHTGYLSLRQVEEGGCTLWYSNRMIMKTFLSTLIDECMAQGYDFGVFRMRFHEVLEKKDKKGIDLLLDEYLHSFGHSPRFPGELMLKAFSIVEDYDFGKPVDT